MLEDSFRSVFILIRHMAGADYNEGVFSLSQASAGAWNARWNSLIINNDDGEGRGGSSLHEAIGGGPLLHKEKSLLGPLSLNKKNQGSWRSSLHPPLLIRHCRDAIPTLFCIPRINGLNNDWNFTGKNVESQ